ncbi:MAG TPA: carbonic anhydrase [Polyangiaceae bacterium]|nr:carbonic anhydrase [Polyangiaceae bacterium]
MARSSISLLFILLATFGCKTTETAQPEKPSAKAKSTAKPTSVKAASSKSKAKEPEHAADEKADAHKADAHKSEAHERPELPQKYVVPFAWEASRDEPLSQARGFLKEILGDNRIYMEHGSAFFAAFAEAQKPRATVVTCSDSRVHTTAFDVTPENDDFMIRNIGNQLANGLGSVEYGVEHLQTPVLMVLGHTGCGAVKAAMGDISGLAEPIRHELEPLHVSRAKAGATPEAAWAEAVVENVRSQVSFALEHFGERVQQGKLTVVGAVYDFRNDLGNGAGKLTVVDVNGNSESERMEAFVQAVETDPMTGKKGARRSGRKADVESPEMSTALKRVILQAREMQSDGKAAGAATEPKNLPAKLHSANEH